MLVCSHDSICQTLSECFGQFTAFRACVWCERWDYQEGRRDKFSTKWRSFDYALHRAIGIRSNKIWLLRRSQWSFCVCNFLTCTIMSRMRCVALPTAKFKLCFQSDNNYLNPSLIFFACQLLGYKLITHIWTQTNKQVHNWRWPSDQRLGWRSCTDVRPVHIPLYAGMQYSRFYILSVNGKYFTSLNTTEYRCALAIASSVWIIAYIFVACVQCIGHPTRSSSVCATTGASEKRPSLRSHQVAWHCLWHMHNAYMHQCMNAYMHTYIHARTHSDYGYGAYGAGGVIPPNAHLEFDVELWVGFGMIFGVRCCVEYWYGA